MGTFRFKQFSVADDNAAMKVGTDGVLLGAWCPVGDAKHILDIGTGSGVIALMLAQRSQPGTHIDAIEVGEMDASQATENVKSSPWPRKVSVIQGAIQDYNAESPYDLIVCNPPYFSNSLLPPDARRTEVRHDARLTHQELITSVMRLLEPSGTFSVILPIAEAATFVEQCRTAGLHLTHRTSFQTRPTKPPERELLNFSLKATTPTVEDILVLYDSHDQQGKDYQRLTGDFYL